MKSELKIYVGGWKPDKLSENWKTELFNCVSNNLKHNMILVDSSSEYINFNLCEDKAKVMFGRECYIIKNCDLVVVGLRKYGVLEDFPVIALAKKYKKHIIGVCLEEDVCFEDNLYCDKIITNIKDFTNEMNRKLTYISQNFDFIYLTDSSIEFYEKEHLFLDVYVRSIFQNE